MSTLYVRADAEIRAAWPMFPEDRIWCIAGLMEHARISIDPDVMGGRACVAGTRVPVHIILGHLGSGVGLAELLEGYPMISQADVQAAITYAADLVEHEGVVAA